MTDNITLDQHTEKTFPSLQEKSDKYKKQLRIAKILTAVSFFLLLFSLFIKVEKRTYSSVPIEYPRFSQSSASGSKCYADSITHYESVFTITHTTYKSGVSYGSTNDIYYLVTDKDGFEFLVCMDSIQENYFFSTLKKSGAAARLYGYATEIDFNGIDFEDDSQKMYQTVYGKYPVLRILTNVQTYQSVPTVSYIVLIAARILLVVLIVALRIWFALVKRKFYKEAGNILKEQKQQLEAQKIQSCHIPIPTEAPEGYELWECKHCGMKNSTQYAQCKKCGKFKGA